MGHPIACAASLTVVKAIVERRLLDNVREVGSYFEIELNRAFGDHPHIGDIRGRGLFRGLEIVKDRKLKQPFDPALNVNVKIKNLALENGMICYPMGGTVDGEKGDHILLAPPFIVTKEDIDSIVRILEIAINSLES